MWAGAVQREHVAEAKIACAGRSAQHGLGAAVCGVRRQRERNVAALPAVRAAVSLPPVHLRRLLYLCVLSLALGAPGVTGAQTPSGPSESAAAAARQLDLGEQWFRSACLECHAIRGLDNADFRLKWDGRNAFELFELIRSTMPESKPGSLTQGTYAAIVAYLMKLNGMPSGARRIASDSGALAAIRLTFPSSASSTR